MKIENKSEISKILDLYYEIYNTIYKIYSKNIESLEDKDINSLDNKRKLACKILSSQFDNVIFNLKNIFEKYYPEYNKFFEWKIKLEDFFDNDDRHPSLCGKKINDIILSDYKTYEIIKKVLDSYDDMAHGKHNPNLYDHGTYKDEKTGKEYSLNGHYSNLLLLSSCIIDHLSNEEYEEWKTKYKKENSCRFQHLYKQKDK